ncbi:MAG: hypothetical protein EOL87_15470 [Spartobacteria bacterium]|nr:hypothetical protein [Spartobacteria bacterium]
MMCAGTLNAATTINETNACAYGANTGWINARGDITNGAVIGQSFCSGHMWSANAGWISLGNGPVNGWQYSNTSSNDWGVNMDENGALSGYAYGANVGWITFEQTHGTPKVDLRTGALSGYIYGANVGWIALSNAQAVAVTDSLAPGADTDHDGIPDAWEYKTAGNLTALSGDGHDADGDFASDVNEYHGNTDPLSAASVLKFVSVEEDSTDIDITWNVEPERLYYVEYTDALNTETTWNDAGAGCMGPFVHGAYSQSVSSASSSTRFYRVRAVLPLTVNR